MRQICLVAHDLERVQAQFERVFGVEVCHVDPGVGNGLYNFLMPFGDQFLEGRCAGMSTKSARMAIGGLPERIGSAPGAPNGSPESAVPRFRPKTLRHSRPAALAARWADVLGEPVREGGGGKACLEFAMRRCDSSACAMDAPRGSQASTLLRPSVHRYSRMPRAWAAGPPRTWLRSAGCDCASSETATAARALPLLRLLALGNVVWLR